MRGHLASMTLSKHDGRNHQEPEPPPSRPEELTFEKSRNSMMMIPAAAAAAMPEKKVRGQQPSTRLK
jgi:hypothetical protein